VVFSVVVFALFGSLAESVLPSGVARAVRRGGWIHLCAVTGRGDRHAAACIPGWIKPCSRRSGRIYTIAVTKEPLPKRRTAWAE